MHTKNVLRRELLEAGGPQQQHFHQVYLKTGTLMQMPPVVTGREMSPEYPVFYRLKFGKKIEKETKHPRYFGNRGRTLRGCL